MPNLSEKMRIGVMLSPGVIFPSLEHPQHLDFLDMLESLSQYNTLYVSGNITSKLNFAEEQLTYYKQNTSPAYKIVKKFGKMLSVLSNKNRFFSKMRSGFERTGNSRLESICYEFFKSKQIDVFYSFPFFPDTYQISVANKLGKPIVSEMWEDQIVFHAEIMHNENYENEDIEKEMQRQYEWLKYIGKESSHVLVPSQSFKKTLARFGYEDSVSIARVCANLPSEKNTGVELRKKYGIDKNIVIYNSSTVSPWHDLDILFDALRQSKEKKKLAVVLTGNKEKLKEKMKPEDEFKIILTGALNQDDGYAHLEMADICVAPYRFHYRSGFFPGKIVRYMMAEKAVIATDLEETREVLNGTGLLVKQGDSQGFANAIDLLVVNNEMQKKMARSSKEIAITSYTWKNHSEKATAIFESVHKETGIFDKSIS